ncbi:MAG: heme-binding protein [Rhodobacteraceae bacterium]|nr:heme-binding protein [Paracoccaceae bacterium]
MTDLTRQLPVISYEAAAGLVTAAMSHARDNGWSIAVVIQDNPWGDAVASGRMDGVALPIQEIASDKAYTATLGKSTRAFFVGVSGAVGPEDVSCTQAALLALGFETKN